MKKALAAMMLLALAPVAEARPIDWQAELDRCRAMREQWNHCCWRAKACLPSLALGARLAAVSGLNGER
jgi:hypothetical protein